MHIDFGLAFTYHLPSSPLTDRISSERKLGSVRRHDRKSGDGPISGESFLIRSFVIHRPDLFVTGAARYEKDLEAAGAGGPKYFQYVGSKPAGVFRGPRLIKRS